MQIIIPMSGFGERFKRAGYEVPKPLIEVEGKPVISHVIDMFPGETNFIFICNEEHLANPAYKMQGILKKYCPTGQIVGIPSHKLGPVYAVRQVEHLIDKKDQVIINYCDFTCYWNWTHFKNFVSESKCIGAIPAYKGFHPHTLGNTNYAYMQESGGWVQDIQEKLPYTDNRMEEYASSGTYYFSSGEVMLKALKTTMDLDLNVSGEYYVSMAYKPLLAEQQRVAVYPLQHFMQWGTPDDLAEYKMWSNAFRYLVTENRANEKPVGSVIIPMAGLGQRFVDEGYSQPKPLIPVSCKPMVIQATDDLPIAQNHVFVLRQDMPGVFEISQMLKDDYPGSIIKLIPSVTEGQACTAMIGLNALQGESKKGAKEPITFGVCDYGMIYNYDQYQELLNNSQVDIIVWGFRGNMNAVRRPKMFGWIDSNNNGWINNISVKSPLDSPSTDPIVLGTFTFKNADNFIKAFHSLVERDGRINGEFYLDSCINDAINLGLKCFLFEVDTYFSWGTPNDLRTFQYWQSCFHKWSSHPYTLETDMNIPIAQSQLLAAEYKEVVPQVPMKYD